MKMKQRAEPLNGLHPVDVMMAGRKETQQHTVQGSSFSLHDPYKDQ
jgi:hypothetical protein